MMIIAKFSSHCAACHQPIAAGTKIEWTKGQPVRHAVCAAAPVSGSYSAPRHTHARSIRTGRRCSCTGPCCAHGCRCESHCNCRGGNVYDC